MNSFLFSSTELAKYFDAAIPISLPATPPTYVQSHSVRNSEGGELRGSCYEIFVGGRREVKRCQVKLICLPQILVLVDSAPAQDPVEVMVVPAIGLAPVQIGLIVLSTSVGRRNLPSPSGIAITAHRKRNRSPSESNFAISSSPNPTN